VWRAAKRLDDGSGLIRPGTEALVREVSLAIPLKLVIGMSAVPLAVRFGALK
jgi:hypothetical protein